MLQNLFLLSISSLHTVDWVRPELILMKSLRQMPPQHTSSKTLSLSLSLFTNPIKPFPHFSFSLSLPHGLKITEALNGQNSMAGSHRAQLPLAIATTNSDGDFSSSIPTPTKPFLSFLMLSSFLVPESETVRDWDRDSVNPWDWVWEWEIENVSRWEWGIETVRVRLSLRSRLRERRREWEWEIMFGKKKKLRNIKGLNSAFW